VSATFDFPTFAASVAKNYYSTEMVEALTLKSAAYAMMPKDTDATGFQFIHAENIAPLTNRSSVPSVAFGATGSSSQYVQWQVQWGDAYAMASVAEKTIAASKGDEGSLIDTVTMETDRSYESLGWQFSAATWGMGGSAIGQLNGSGSVTGTAALSLTNPAQGANFVKGQVLNSSATNGTTGAVRAGSVTIAVVDILNGTITPTANWNSGIAAITNADFLFNQGDFGTASQAGGGYTPGIPAWIPDVNNRPVAGTPFSNVDRAAQDPIRTAGFYYNGGGGDYAQSILTGLTIVQRFNPLDGPDVAFCAYTDFGNLVKSMYSRTQNIVETKATSAGEGTVGFKGIKVHGPAGAIDVYPDTFCPSGTSSAGNPTGAWLLNIKRWLVPSLGENPQLLDMDGNEWRMVPADAIYQRKIGGHFAIYGGRSPFCNCVVTF
jgi:hypothetical protein